MAELTVFQRLSASTDQLIAVVKDELNLKCCLPFAVRAVDALKVVAAKIKTDAQAKKVANRFLDNLQTLTAGGILTEDYDLIDFVERGGTVCISPRIELLFRAAARKGYRIAETTIGVPADDLGIYFEEAILDGRRAFILKDDRKNLDRKITVDRILDGYFSHFICRLVVSEIQSGRILAEHVEEVSNADILGMANSSDNGIFKTRWEGEPGHKRKVVSKERNEGSFWHNWTTSMVKKSVIRRAFKILKETLPELEKTMFAFDNDEDIKTEPRHAEADVKQIEAQVVAAVDVNLDALTPAQEAAATEMFEIYKQNPKAATEDAKSIAEALAGGAAAQRLINERFAEIVNIRKSSKLKQNAELWAKLAPVFGKVGTNA